MSARTNWAGNVQYTAPNLHVPSTVEEVQRIVRDCDHITALGSRHSFSRIADNSENQISYENMNRILSLDSEASAVTIEAGIRYSELAPYLHEHGFALHNMASLPHISVAGAVATATHGSGLMSGNLATAVTAIEIVDAAGNLVTLSEQDESFNGAVVSLGALGMVTKLTLKVQPTFDMTQTVYKNLQMSELKGSFEDLESHGYSVSLFTDWKQQSINEAWFINKVGHEVSPEDIALYGMEPATVKTHPVEGHSTEALTEQLGVPGPWYERMPHFKTGFQPSVGNELQSEYYVPIGHAYDAMMALQKVHEQMSPHLYISEIRTIGVDNLWMSPCYQRSCVAFHFTWRQHPEVVDELLPLIEEVLEPYKPVPHWGKLFTMSPAVLQSRFERLGDYKRLIGAFDVNGKFRNEFITKNLYS